MKILVAAWACNTLQGSEAAVGWTWLAAIKDLYDVDVLTARYQQDWIEAEIRRRHEEFARVRFHYLEPPGWGYEPGNRFWQWQADVPLLVPLFHRYYRRWLWQAYQAASELNRREHFDLVHQLTFVSFRFPGHLWKLGVPFVWGPIGGFENTPWHLLPAIGRSGAAYYAARNIVNSAHKRLLRGPRQAFQRASAVIAATSGIQAEILRWHGVPSEVICEVGLPFEPATQFEQRNHGEQLRITWSARHLPGKALHFLLRALSRVPESMDWRLDIFGDGPCQSNWRALALHLGIDARCRWHGQLPRDEALSRLRRSHILVVTSVKDLTSTVIIEALASGVPVICPDHCGFSDAVTAHCGIKIPIKSVRRFVSALAETIASVHSDEGWRRHLAAGALKRARDFTLEAKTEMIERIYRNILEQRSLPDHLDSDLQT